MRDLRTYINEALNEKSAIDMLVEIYDSNKTTIGTIPQEVIDYLVKNGEMVDSVHDMKEGESYIVLTPNMWVDNEEMKALSYYEGFVKHKNMENKKPDSWKYTLSSKALRIPGKFEWLFDRKYLPGGCGIERLDKKSKNGFYFEHYYIINVTPKLKSFAENLLKTIG